MSHHSDKILSPPPPPKGNEVVDSESNMEDREGENQPNLGEKGVKEETSGLQWGK